MTWASSIAGDRSTLDLKAESLTQVERRQTMINIHATVAWAGVYRSERYIAKKNTACRSQNEGMHRVSTQIRDYVAWKISQGRSNLKQKACTIAKVRTWLRKREVETAGGGSFTNRTTIMKPWWPMKVRSGRVENGRKQVTKTEKKVREAFRLGDSSEGVYPRANKY